VVLHLPNRASVYYDSLSAPGVAPSQAPCALVIDYLFRLAFSSDVMRGAAATCGFDASDDSHACWANIGDTSKFAAPVPSPVTCPRQGNLSDCGIFVVATATACLFGTEVSTRAWLGSLFSRTLALSVHVAHAGFLVRRHWQDLGIPAGSTQQVRKQYYQALVEASREGP
jgi:hypothetical protein